MRLTLSRHLTFHARGADDCFSWHQLTGDCCQMSRDVVALCLAFVDGADDALVAAARPGGIAEAQAREFATILRARRVLVAEGEDEWSLGAFRPYTPRLAVWRRDGDDVVIHGRDAELRIDGARAFFDGADGSRPLSVLADRARWPALLAACDARFAALKLLPPGASVPRAAETTMPWPRADPRALTDGSPALSRPEDLHRYHAAIEDAEAQFDEVETTLSHLFRSPHPSLGGETYGARLARGLVARGARSQGARVVEVGGGLGWVGRALVGALSPSSYLVVDRSPSLGQAQRQRGLRTVRADATRLPIADRSVDLVISNEMAGDLATEGGVNVGALALVDECARVLAPGGLAWISEFGHPTDAPRRSDHLDHDEYSLRFEDLRVRAAGAGLSAEIVLVPDVVGLDGTPDALITTRASFASLRNLFRAHGGDLAKRAWLRSELEAHAAASSVDLAAIHGVAWAPIGERTMGIVPGEFWALIARRGA